MLSKTLGFGERIRTLVLPLESPNVPVDEAATLELCPQYFDHPIDGAWVPCSLRHSLIIHRFLALKNDVHVHIVLNAR